MILEALEYATLPAAPWARRTGHLKELIAVEGRYRRHGRAWWTHLDNTKSTILAAVELCERRRTALVLGSGPLYDIPLKALAAQFDRIVLIDAAHPWRARLSAWRRRNVALVHADLSGVCDGLLLGVAAGADTPPEPRLSPLPNVKTDDVDLVVSANLMSQLPLVPLAFVQQRLPLSTDAESRFARAILHAHMSFLNEFPGVRCLITDRTRETRDHGGALHGDSVHGGALPDGALIDAKDALYGLELPAPDQEWIWDIAPLGEISRHESVRNHVLAITTSPLTRRNAASP
jgi:hypothetical protein